MTTTLLRAAPQVMASSLMARDMSTISFLCCDTPLPLLRKIRNSPTDSPTTTLIFSFSLSTVSETSTWTRACSPMPHSHSGSRQVLNVHTTVCVARVMAACRGDVSKTAGSP